MQAPSYVSHTALSHSKPMTMHQKLKRTNP
jgi:hypothetical protein